MRSSDGHVAQHVKAKDIGLARGQLVRQHAQSIGIEHEGFAAQGATWYTEALYRELGQAGAATWRNKYGIPLDRAHIIGHDQVPGTLPATVAGMHWDPGPYWDWEHYFDLLGAPIDGTTVPVKAGRSSPIKPGFADNVQVVTNCDADRARPALPQGTNFVYLRTAAGDAAPLVKDSGCARRVAVDDAGLRHRRTGRGRLAVRRGRAVRATGWLSGTWARSGWFKSPRSRRTLCRSRVSW